MIKEETLLHIIKEINYHLTSIAKELDPQRVPMDVVRLYDEVISLKYLREKTMAIKSHMEWLEAEMDEV